MAFKNDVAKAVKASGMTTTAAAAHIGVTYPSLKAVLDGKSLPNARSLGKYAKFLGVDENQLREQVEKEKDATGRRPGRPRKDGKKKKTAAKKRTGAKKKTGAKKTTAAKRGPGRPRKTAAPAAAPKVDKRLVRSLESSLKSLDDLRGKIETALAKLK
jgi:transcriptional regulator with XRE-family HTH domain